MNTNLADFLTRKVEEYNQISFIENDPILVPHQFTVKQDIEIAGFFAAVFAWGNRRTIIAKALELMRLMDNAPHDFIKNHTESDLKPFLAFKHRTFNATDLLWFLQVLQMHYKRHPTLATAFFPPASKSKKSTHSYASSHHLDTFNTNPNTTDPHKDIVKNGLIQLQTTFFTDPDAPQRTKKHLSTPARNSGCKRLNMYLRWMVRKDNNGVDFGLWDEISPADLIIPIDVHVARVARKFNLITRKQPDWLAAEELTGHLKRLDLRDPAKYDFALFGLGVMEKF